MVIKLQLFTLHKEKRLPLLGSACSSSPPPAQSLCLSYLWLQKHQVGQDIKEVEQHVQMIEEELPRTTPHQSPSVLQLIHTAHEIAPSFPDPPPPAAASSTECTIAAVPPLLYPPPSLTQTPPNGFLVFFTGFTTFMVKIKSSLLL